MGLNKASYVLSTDTSHLTRILQVSAESEEKHTASKADDDTPYVIRTATGGFINTVMILLTVFAFIGNGAFLIYVFWLSK